jgi:YD repeat-containing protein
MVPCLYIFIPSKPGGFALTNIRKKGTARCYVFLLAFVVSLLAWNIGAQAAGPSYVYDALGRLVTVYDASGNAAVYKYDAVGNLLSITNSSSTTFAALELSLSSGVTGSTVTIYGRFLLEPHGDV